MAPRDVVLVRPGRLSVFLNTSLQILNGFDYLFDAERSLVGSALHRFGLHKRSDGRAVDHSDFRSGAENRAAPASVRLV